jgi:hypothetical protein
VCCILYVSVNGFSLLKRIKYSDKPGAVLTFTQKITCG